jgi:hypothetical protein
MLPVFAVQKIALLAVFELEKNLEVAVEKKLIELVLLLFAVPQVAVYSVELLHHIAELFGLPTYLHFLRSFLAH